MITDDIPVLLDARGLAEIVGVPEVGVAEQIRKPGPADEAPRLVIEWTTGL